MITAIGILFLLNVMNFFCNIRPIVSRNLMIEFRSTIFVLEPMLESEPAEKIDEPDSDFVSASLISLSWS